MALQMPPRQPSRLTRPTLDEESDIMKLHEGGQSSAHRESSVTYIYQARVIKSLRNIVITWSKASTIHSLTITIENLSDEEHQSCHIDFQSWQSWSKKGLKSLNVDDERVDIFWDFRDVKFSTNPEPRSGYYMAVVFKKEMVLLLGDSDGEAYKRVMCNPSPVSPTLLHKEEILHGSSSFCTKVLLDKGTMDHNVVIENPMRRSSENELRIRIDGRVVVRVMNLKWRFRGNETVLVNNEPVQIFWDLHDWLFRCPGSGHGLFIFKPGPLKNILDDEAQGKTVAGGCHFVFAVKLNDG